MSSTHTPPSSHEKREFPNSFLRFRESFSLSLSLCLFIGVTRTTDTAPPSIFLFFFQQLTEPEAALLKFSIAAQRALVAPFDQASQVEQEALGFFKGEFLLRLNRVFPSGSVSLGSTRDKGRGWLVNVAFASFFKKKKDLQVLLAKTIEDNHKLPWQVVQVGSIALEAFELVELGIEQRLDEMVLQKIPDQVQSSPTLFFFLIQATPGDRC